MDGLRKGNIKVSNQEVLDAIVPEIQSECNEILTHLFSLGHTASFQEMEATCLSGMRRISEKLIGVLIASSGSGYQGNRIPCSCGEEADFEGLRPKSVQTVVGNVRFSRAYYHCKHCGAGICPLDEVLGVTRKQMTRTLERFICRLSAVESFESVAEDLYDLTGASVCAKTAQTASEAEGADILAKTRAEAAEAVAGERKIEADENPEALCITMDGKMIPTPSGHRELKIAAIYDLAPSKDESEREIGKTTYLAQFAEPDLFGESVWYEAGKRGAEIAKEVIILGDGAPWIWNQAQTHYPEAIQILDFWHVSQHIWELGNIVYGEGTKKTKRFVGYKLDQIRAGKVGMVITALRKLKVSDEKKDHLRQAIGYLEANRKRMRYLKYRNKGYHIGSGVVESAAKQFGARLDQAGMRWSIEGAGGIAALRALRLSGTWDAHWKPVRQPLLA